MINWLKTKFGAPNAPVDKTGVASPTAYRARSLLDFRFNEKESRESVLERVHAANVQRGAPTPIDRYGNKLAMDGAADFLNQFASPGQTNLPTLLLDWYGAQGFIGYYACVIIAQHWLVRKACAMPPSDAFRNGFTTTSNDGQEIAEDVLDAIAQGDKKYHLQRNMHELIEKGRVFGVRVAIFEVRSDDPEYYLKPFNIDGVLPGSYKGISQVDPMWITPELDLAGASDPASIDFYEPTWWRVGNVRYHKSHLVVYRPNEVEDILKPTYFYGGIPVPQQIYERVYSAERSANEAPLLLMTKRMDVLNCDLDQAIADQALFEKKLRMASQIRDNLGTRVIGLGENYARLDTALNDVDAVIMTQYTICAAIANVPITKLLGTSPKGFNATGEGEERNYHEFLETLQVSATPLIERHHELLIKSEIAPKFGIAPFKTSVVWQPVSTMSAKELAEVNELKSRSGVNLVNSGAISGEDERSRIVNDPESGYNGIPAEIVEEDPLAELFGVSSEPVANGINEDPTGLVSPDVEKI